MAIEVRMTGRAPETVDEAFHRLAAEARRQNVVVYRVAGPKGPQWFSPSQSRPGGVHALTAVSCDCDGFVRWQRCMHHSALLDHLGWLPVIGPDPEPDPPATPVAMVVPLAPCPDCHGEGWRKVSTGGGLSDWVMVDCRRCQRVAA